MHKMIVSVVLLVLIVSINAFGAGFIGTPTAELKKGQLNVGFNYTYIDMELAKTNLIGTWEAFENGALLSSDSESSRIEIDNVKTQRYYTTIGYGLTDSWEAYAQLGLADLKLKMRDADEPDHWDGLNFDNDFAWGWGTRYTFHEKDKIRWGASVQMNWLDTSWDKRSTRWFGTDYEQVDYETYDLLIAVGPAVDMGGWDLYGGPFYYYLSGDFDFEHSRTFEAGESSMEVVRAGADLESDSDIGGFIGAKCTLKENYDITTELSFTGDSWAIGTGIAVLF